MDYSRKTLIRLFLIIFIICTLAYVVSAQENETIDSVQQEFEISTTRNETISELSQNTNDDSIIGVQSDLDRSLDILNIVATLLGVLVGVLTLIIAIIGALGFLEIRKWRKVRENIDEDVDTIREIRSKAEDELNILREGIKNNHFPSLSEKPSEEIITNLDDFASRLELLEIMGVSLKSEDYSNRASDLYFKGKYELALKSIEKAIELEPGDSKAWYNKGVILSDLGRDYEVLKANEKAIELNPDNVGAWYNKGIALSHLNRHDEALRAIEKTIELKPDDADAWSYKSVLLRDLGRHDEALQVIEKVIELNSDFANAWYNYSCIYYSIKGDKEKALSFLRKAIEIDASYKDKSKKDKDLENLWEDEDFKIMTE